MHNQSTWVTVLRWIGATVLALVAALALPAGLIAQWMKEDILDTSGFVDQLRPLSESAAFQSRLATAAADGISKAVTESDAVGQLQSLATGAAGLVDLLPFGTDLAESTENLSAQIGTQIHDVVEEQTLTFVRSSAFPPVWASAVGEVHGQVVAVLSGEQAAATDAEGTAVLTIQVGPLVGILKETLTTEGQWWARLIPAVNMEVSVAELHNLPTLQRYYNLFENAEIWVLVIGVAAAVIAIALAPRRLLVIGAGALAAFFVTALVWHAVPGFGAEHLRVVTDADAAAMSQQVWDLLSAPLLTSLQRGAGIALIVAIAALVVALIAYLRGRSFRRG